MKRLSLLFIVICFVISLASQIRAEISLNEVYKIGINDVLEIKVLDHDDLRTMATVSSDGTITFPFIGTVLVKGKGILEIEEDITERLKTGYIKYPVVTVSLVRSMSRKFYTYGSFNRRGEVPFEDNMTIVRAISVSGGIMQDGLFGSISVRRKLADDSNEYKNFVKTDLNNGFIDDQKIGDMFLMPDDILIVERNKTFLIEGQVAKRGRIVLERDMTVLMALLQAGGVSPDGLYGTIKVRRKKDEKSGEYNEIVASEINDGVIEDSKVEETILKPDDILIVERNKTFLIEGQVAKRGRMALETDMTVLMALLQAGGVSPDGSYGTIKVRRKKDDKSGGYSAIAESGINDGVIEDSAVEETILKPDDILIVERNKTFLIEGEVAKRGRIVLEKDMTVLVALLQAGGVSPDGLYGTIKVRRKKNETSGEYKDLIEAKINNGVIEDSEAEATILRPYDILIVEKNKTFFVYGEVNRNGEFVLMDDMTVFKALTNAGGFTKWGSASRVKVLRKIDENSQFETIKVKIDDVIDGDATADILLQPGDTVVVSKGVF